MYSPSWMTCGADTVFDLSDVSGHLGVAAEHAHAREAGLDLLHRRDRDALRGSRAAADGFPEALDQLGRGADHEDRRSLRTAPPLQSPPVRAARPASQPLAFRSPPRGRPVVARRGMRRRRRAPRDQADVEVGALHDVARRLPARAFAASFSRSASYGRCGSTGSRVPLGAPSSASSFRPPRSRCAPGRSGRRGSAPPPMSGSCPRRRDGHDLPGSVEQRHAQRLVVDPDVGEDRERRRRGSRHRTSGACCRRSAWRWRRPCPSAPARTPAIGVSRVSSGGPTRPRSGPSRGIATFLSGSDASARAATFSVGESRTSSDLGAADALIGGDQAARVDQEPGSKASSDSTSRRRCSASRGEGRMHSPTRQTGSWRRPGTRVAASTWAFLGGELESRRHGPRKSSVWPTGRPCRKIGGPSDSTV